MADPSWPHFSHDELKCSHCGDNQMDEAFMQRIEALRMIYDKSMVVSSAYRCSYHNNNVSSTGGTGPHTTGKAIDFSCAYGTAMDILLLATSIGFNGIGISQKGDPKSRFIHLDMLERIALWSY